MIHFFESKKKFQLNFTLTFNTRAIQTPVALQFGAARICWFKSIRTDPAAIGVNNKVNIYVYHL